MIQTRARVLLFATAFGMVGANLFGQPVNPTVSKEPCPNGGFRIVWNYPPGSPVPENATPVPCDVPGGCPSFLLSACLELVDVTRPITARDLPPVHGKPEIAPDAELPRPNKPPQPIGIRPTNPAGVTPGALPPPDQSGCIPGTGWDFEEVKTDVNHPGAFFATFQKWSGDQESSTSPFRDFANSDLDLKAAPVYGNAAPIDRIRPPGWLPDIENQIGGDYWTYSQAVNQQGDFWISSLYRRYSWRQHPGDQRAETDIGTLTSPSCRLGARYLAFRMSGARSSSQRVEVQVRGGRRADYFGIAFPGKLGDTSLNDAGHATQFSPLPPATQSFPPPDQGEWVVVRSAMVQDPIDETPDVPGAEFWNRSEWMQTYVFDLEPFLGQEIQIRIVDDGRNECVDFQGGSCLHYAPEHINADAFQFLSAAPEGTKWMPFDEGRCGGVAGTGKGCSPVGRVPSTPPLWGVTDAHAHPMANIGFGGHVVWGDVTDTLDNVYDCSRQLPAIAGPGGRAAISDPAHTSACYLAGDVVVLVGAIVHAGCTALQVIPVIGLGVASVCHGVVSAAEVALLSTPIIEGLTLHGGNKLSSGGVKMGAIFSRAWLSVMVLIGQAVGDPSFAFDIGLIPTLDAWPNAAPTLDWYRDDGADHPDEVEWHSFTGLGKSHNLYQAEMIRRAYQGGMRLGVWDVVNSRALAFVADGEISSDWKALKDETDAAKRIVATALNDIAAIAYSPQQADTIVRSGKMAVILGTEVDELGRPRPDGLPWPRSPHTAGDSMQKQVDDLWELGIRKITPVHAVNNPIGGPAIFYGQYGANNHFLNGTPVDGEPSFFDLPAVRFVIDRSPWLPFEVVLGQFAVFRDVGGDGIQTWNPFGWFDFSTGPTLGAEKIVGPDSAITYRLGQDKPKNGVLRDAAGWLAPSDVLGKQMTIATAFSDLSTLIRPLGHCVLYNTFKPRYADSFGAQVDLRYRTLNGHLNALGLYRAPDGGEAFLRAAMKKGMILDVDHMSQRMREDVYALSKKYASEAGSHLQCQFGAPCDLKNCPSGLLCGDYPFMGVHTTVRDLEKEGSLRAEVVGAFGSTDESTRTPGELEYVVANGGAVGVFPRGSAFIPPNTSGGRCTKDSDCGGYAGFGSGSCELPAGKCKADAPKPGIVLAQRDFELPAEVQNDCDLSSKTFAVKYLWLMNRMKGRGLTLTTDLNGLIGTIDPRFGGATPGKNVCGKDKRGTLDGGGRPLWWSIMTDAQKVEHSGVWYDDYSSLGDQDSAVASAWTDPNPTPHKRWRQVVARRASDIREDRAPRYPIDEVVYYNDHGPDLAPHHWYDQGANVPGAQLRPLKRWRKARAGWDFNLDGMQHIGLLPDLIQDMRSVGVQWEQLGPMFRGAQDYLDLWQRATAIGAAHP